MRGCISLKLSTSCNSMPKPLEVLYDEVKGNDSAININAVRSFFSRHGKDVSVPEANRLFSLLDKDKDSVISRDEFESFFSPLVAKEQTSSERPTALTPSQLSAFWIQRTARVDYWTPTIDIAAGGMAGCVSRTLTSPLERLKILRQVQESRDPTHLRYSSIWQSLTRIFHEEGWKGYFKGNGANVARIAPYSAVQFGVYERMRKVTQDSAFPRPVISMATGAVSGVMAVVVTYPLDVTRAHLTIQVTDIKYKGVIDCAKSVVKQKGLYGLYQGMWPTVAGIAPYVAINFTCYERLKEIYIKKTGHVPSSWATLGIGAVSGAVAQTFTYPIDLIRRRMQLQGILGEITDDRLKYKSINHAFRSIIKYEGWLGLYRGMIPCYLKVVPAIGISFVAYETTKRVLTDIV